VSDPHAARAVAPGVEALPLRTPTLPPATHTQAYLVGRGEFVLVEPASPYEDEVARAVAWVEARLARGERLRAILATHHHPDHIGGAVALADRLAAPLWAHAATAERLRGRVSFARHLDDGELLVLDGDPPLRLRAVHTPGHAPGHLCFLDEDSRALLAGDMVASEGTILVETTDGDMALYLASLARLDALGASVLLPAHGAPIADAHTKFTGYVAHRLAREAKILAALRGRRDPCSAEALVPEAYTDAPQAVWPLAALSAEAHLVKLAQEGHAERSEQGWRAVRRG
jgi:glyoxylase-like metal-dependent hydrolase (beta-lactamase superfamily II)